MSLKLVQYITLLAATVTTGLIAGLFFSFTTAVMPALGRSSDRTFVETMNNINVAILNGWFLSCFMGALVFSLLAVLTHLPRGGRSVLPWIIAGFVLYLSVIVITGAINVPLNNDLAKTSATDPVAALTAARTHFQGAWVRWNTVRTLASIAAFGCLVGALFTHTRTVTGS